MREAMRHPRSAEPYQGLAARFPFLGRANLEPAWFLRWFPMKDETELMSRLISVGRIGAGVVLAGLVFGLTAAAQTAPAGGAPGPSPARQAVDVRKAAYTLIGANFRPLVAVLKGAPFDAADAEKRASRLTFLADLLDESFPAVSNLGEPDTKAKAEIWSNLPDFTKRLTDFQGHIAELARVATTEKSATDAFKAAVAAVGQDCKSCHDTYRIQ